MYKCFTFAKKMFFLKSVIFFFFSTNSKSLSVLSGMTKSFVKKIDTSPGRKRTGKNTF